LPKAVEVELRDPETRKAFKEHARQQVALHGWEWLEDLVHRAQERGDDRLLRDVRAMMLGFGHGTPRPEQEPASFDLGEMIRKVSAGIAADKAASPRLALPTPSALPSSAAPVKVARPMPDTSEVSQGPMGESAAKPEAVKPDPDAPKIWHRTLESHMVVLQPGEIPPAGPRRFGSDDW